MRKFISVQRDRLPESLTAQFDRVADSIDKEVIDSGYSINKVVLDRLDDGINPGKSKVTKYVEDLVDYGLHYPVSNLIIKEGDKHQFGKYVLECQSNKCLVISRAGVRIAWIGAKNLINFKAGDRSLYVDVRCPSSKPWTKHICNNTCENGIVVAFSSNGLSNETSDADSDLALFTELAKRGFFHIYRETDGKVAFEADGAHVIFNSNGSVADDLKTRRGHYPGRVTTISGQRLDPKPSKKYQKPETH